MDLLHIAGGPVIGALIGYCTNYLAVKMLFRPIHPVKIGNYTLPFTPGVIPRRKDALARAVGEAVESRLLTSQDIMSYLISENTKNAVTEVCTNALYKAEERDGSLRDNLLLILEEEQYKKQKEALVSMLAQKLTEQLGNMQIGDIMAKEAREAVEGMAQGTMFAMFLNEQLMEQITQPIGERVQQWILKNGGDYLRPVIEEELRNLEDRPFMQLTDQIPLDFVKIQNQIAQIYDKCMRDFAKEIARSFPVSSIVEERIKKMDPLELEELVLSVMKHELNMLVNLGALIGFLLGILNIFI